MTPILSVDEKEKQFGEKTQHWKLDITKVQGRPTNLFDKTSYCYCYGYCYCCCCCFFFFLLLLLLLNWKCLSESHAIELIIY